MSDTLARVTATTAEHLARPRDAVTPESTFVSLGADSLDVVELMMALEEEFGIEIDDKTIGDVMTVGDVVAYIDGTLSKAA